MNIICTTYIRTPQLPVLFGSLLPFNKPLLEITGSWGVLLYTTPSSPSTAPASSGLNATACLRTSICSISSSLRRATEDPKSAGGKRVSGAWLLPPTTYFFLLLTTYLLSYFLLLTTYFLTSYCLPLTTFLLLTAYYLLITYFLFLISYFLLLLLYLLSVVVRFAGFCGDFYLVLMNIVVPNGLATFCGLECTSAAAHSSDLILLISP